MKKTFKTIFKKSFFIVAMAVAFLFICDNPKSVRDSFAAWRDGDKTQIIAYAMNNAIETFGYNDRPDSRIYLKEAYSAFPEEFSEESIAKMAAAGFDIRGGGSVQQASAPAQPQPITKVSEEVTKQPTCTEAGELTIKYSDGGTKTQELPALEHQYELTETVESTCGIEGYNEYTCTRCGDSYRETIPALEHEWELAETIEPTCTEDGKRIYKCKICGETKEETIPAKEHEPSDWQIVKEAGFFAEGEKQIVCTVCGEVLETERIPAKQDWRIWLGCGAGLIVLVIITSTIVIKKKKKTT